MCRSGLAYWNSGQLRFTTAALRAFLRSATHAQRAAYFVGIVSLGGCADIGHDRFGTDLALDRDGFFQLRQAEGRHTGESR